ncbi:uncharacterized protein LOC133720517 [Rosa rugosa]|uniref:uncharacterized protein LOC133720517 n=1 Tax=Rosa rugosa TaxID=74645 RepID=UPI002B40E1F7|nr:uncharacterized protein LOC133720517 [Rosa rugosa]
MLRLSEDVPGQFAVSGMEAGKESPSSLFTPELLNLYNYEDWSVQVETYLLAEDLWDILEPTYEPPKREDGEAEFKAWRKKNARALLAIRFSCGPDTVSLIRKTRMAKVAWNTLAQKFASSPQILGIYFVSLPTLDSGIGMLTLAHPTLTYVSENQTYYLYNVRIITYLE